jgi:HK97 family phage major capsid protein
MNTQQREQILSQPHYRLASITREAVDVENRTVGCTFASTAPVERWWGIEILDMSMARLERWKNRPPLLENHRERRGVILNGDIVDGKLRGIAKLSRNPQGEQLLQDILDGIAVHTSVGYMVHDMIEMKPEEMDDELKAKCLETGLKAYRCAFEPFEGSIVDVPADITVGVGNRSIEYYDPKSISDPVELINEIRSFRDQNISNPPPATEVVGAGQQSTTINIRGSNMEQTNTVPTPPNPEDLLRAERERVEGIETVSKKFVGRVKDVEELKVRAIREGWSTERFKGEIADRITDGQPVMTPDSEIGLSPREARSYSLLRLIQHQLTDGKVRADFELECAEEIKRRTGKQFKGTPIPWEVQNRDLGVRITSASELEQLRSIALRSGMYQAARALTAATAGGAAELVGTTLRADMFIDLLRNRAVAGQVGVQVLTGVVGKITFPRQTAAGNWEWTGESGTTTGSQLSTGSITLTPKEGRAFQEYTRMLLLQSTPSIELLVQNDLLAIARLGIDKAVFHGSGTSNQPKGIINETGIGSVDGTNLSWSGVVDFETHVASANADVATMFYVTNPTIRGLLKTRTKVSGQPVYLMSEDGTVNGYQTVVSNQISSGHIFFGDFSQEVLVYFGNLDLLVNPYAKDKEGITRVNIYADVDCALRQAGAIAASSNVT